MELTDFQNLMKKMKLMKDHGQNKHDIRKNEHICGCHRALELGTFSE